MKRDLSELWSGWEPVQLIGRGSFGTVYEIQRKLPDGTVEKAAIKAISIPQKEEDLEELQVYGYDNESLTVTFKEHLKSIVAEYNLMRKLNSCDNVVSCDDIRYIQHDDGIGWDIYIRMELLSPLMKYFPSNTGGISEETVFQVAKDICSALEACKVYSIVHRDIKPQNIFVSSNGTFKLGDFGIAKTIEKTVGGTKIGTYQYMAPEVYNNQAYGTTADIYSLGLVLYWMLNERRMPFMPLPPEKPRMDLEEAARDRRMAGEPLPPPKTGSKELKAIVLKACAFEPKDRYHSASEMLEALKKADGSYEEEQRLAEEERKRKLAEEERRRRIAEQEKIRRKEEEGKRAEAERLAEEEKKRTKAAQFEEEQRHAAEQAERRLRMNEQTGYVQKQPVGNRKKRMLIIASLTLITLASLAFLCTKLPIHIENIANKKQVVIIKHPADVYGTAGDRVAMLVEAEGEGLSYQWWIASANHDEFRQSKADSKLYTTLLTDKSIGRQVYCVVTDKYGNSVTTDIATIHANKTKVYPIIITKQPENTTGSDGDKIEISVKATGNHLSYQWWYVPDSTSLDFEEIGECTDTLSLTMSSKYDGAELLCIISDDSGNYVSTRMTKINMS